MQAMREDPLKVFRYQSWAVIDDGDGDPLHHPLRKHLTRRWAEAQAERSCSDWHLQIGLLMAKVYQDVDIKVTPEVTEI